MEETKMTRKEFVKENLERDTKGFGKRFGAFFQIYSQYGYNFDIIVELYKNCIKDSGLISSKEKKEILDDLTLIKETYVITNEIIKESTPEKSQESVKATIPNATK